MTDIHPNDINPETDRPYPGYSSPALDDSLHRAEMDVDDGDDDDGCCPECGACPGFIGAECDGLCDWGVDL